jgi:adenosylhomocysteine nucleosidase
MRLRTTQRLLAVTALLFTFACAPPPAAAPAYVAVIGIATEVAHVESALSGVATQKIRGLAFTTGALGKDRVVLVRSGVGKVNAAMVATLLVDHFAPSAVFFSGTAGAVDPELGPGDIVIGSAVGYHDYGSDTAREFVRWQTRSPVSGERNPLLFAASPELLEAARRAVPTLTLKASESAVRSRPSVREGVILTGDSFMANPVRRDELRRTLNASAVEMEGAAVVQVCAQLGVPVLVIRSITDSSDGTAPANYQLFIESASRNAAELTLATIKQLSASGGTHRVKPAA